MSTKDEGPTVKGKSTAAIPDSGNDSDTDDGNKGDKSDESVKEFEVVFDSNDSTLDGDSMGDCKLMSDESSNASSVLARLLTQAHRREAHKRKKMKEKLKEGNVALSDESSEDSNSSSDKKPKAKKRNPRPSLFGDDSSTSSVDNPVPKKNPAPEKKTSSDDQHGANTEINDDMGNAENKNENNVEENTQDEKNEEAEQKKDISSDSSEDEDRTDAQKARRKGSDRKNKRNDPNWWYIPGKIRLSVRKLPNILLEGKKMWFPLNFFNKPHNGFLKEHVDLTTAWFWNNRYSEDAVLTAAPNALSDEELQRIHEEIYNFKQYTNLAIIKRLKKRFIEIAQKYYTFEMGYRLTKFNAVLKTVNADCILKKEQPPWDIVFTSYPTGWEIEEELALMQTLKISYREWTSDSSPPKGWVAKLFTNMYNQKIRRRCKIRRRAKRPLDKHGNPISRKGKDRILPDKDIIFEKNVATARLMRQNDPIWVPANIRPFTMQELLDHFHKQFDDGKTYKSFNNFKTEMENLKELRIENEKNTEKPAVAQVEDRQSLSPQKNKTRGPTTPKSTPGKKSKTPEKPHESDTDEKEESTETDDVGSEDEVHEKAQKESSEKRLKHRAGRPCDVEIRPRTIYAEDPVKKYKKKRKKSDQDEDFIIEESPAKKKNGNKTQM